MFAIGFGVTLDVEDLPYAIFDRDQTTLSHNYANNISGSRYFVEKPPIHSYEELDRRMQSGDIALAIEIPGNFARDVAKGTPIAIGAWVDGAMPKRAETIRGYVQGLHQGWLTSVAKYEYGMELKPAFNVEMRYRYNPDIQSIQAIVPAIIPILLLLIPSMLTALSVVREKEMGSIINLYVTPVTKLEFLLGKQIPYVAISMLNYTLMVILAIYFFGVPMKGSFLALSLVTLLFCIFSTGFGLLASTLTNSQIGAIFFTVILTLIPAVQFSGLINPVSSLEGFGAIVGQIYPTSHMLTATRGVFSKALHLNSLTHELMVLIIVVPIIILASVALLKKQEA